MDFLTRLAQRLTGELPAVQPRLPLLFEPVAGLAQPVALPDEGSWPATSGPTRALQIALPPPRPAPSDRTELPQAIVHSLEPPRRPGSGIESARPAGAPAADVGQDSAAPPFAVPPDPERRPPPQVSTSPRRVPVEIRPAADYSASPPPPPNSRRNAITAGRVEDATGPLRADRLSESSPPPPTVHVHIGRVDVRAVMPSAAPSRPASRPPAPRLTLEDYLSGRKGGSQP